MLKYVKNINPENKQCSEVFVGTNVQWAKSQGFTEQEVEQSDKDGRWYLKGFAPMKTDEEKAAEEAERIAMLNLTAADVERAIYRAKGIDFEDVIKKVEKLNSLNVEELDSDTNSSTSQPITPSTSIDLKALKIELKANNFYRGNPYIDAVGTILGFTKEQLDEFFETNDYTKLM